MRFQPVHHGMLFCLITAFVLFCVSCGNRPSTQGDTSNVNANKCVIELSGSLQRCDLSITADDRIVWKNSSASPLYACVDPSQTPFDAYGWYVPGNGGVRSSGKIRKDVVANVNVQIQYYSSTQICVWPPPSPIKSTPIIIIHPAE